MLRFALLALMVSFGGCSSRDPAGWSRDPTGGCCVVCSIGKPCGNSCISVIDVCNVGPGCACDEDGNPAPGGGEGEGEGEGEPQCVDGERRWSIGSECCTSGSDAPCICPDYWVCTEACGGNGGNGKICEQPFPDAPGGDSSWADCYEEEGLITCTGDAESFDDAGMGEGWDCETQAEFVVCTSEADDYPDGGDGEGWQCYWNEEERVCEYRDEGGWECQTFADGSTECVSDSPDAQFPDEGGEAVWECWTDESGVRHCTD